jgi:hypothetical protein
MRLDMLRLSAMKPRSMCVRAMAHHKRGPLVPDLLSDAQPLAVLPKRMSHASMARGRCRSPLGIGLLTSYQVKRHAKLPGVQKLAIQPNLGDENPCADPDMGNFIPFAGPLEGPFANTDERRCGAKRVCR